LGPELFPGAKTAPKLKKMPLSLREWSSRKLTKVIDAALTEEEVVCTIVFIAGVEVGTGFGATVPNVDDEPPAKAKPVLTYAIVGQTDVISPTVELTFVPS
jgi:hypothetical protein